MTPYIRDEQGAVAHTSPGVVDDDLQSSPGVALCVVAPGHSQDRVLAGIGLDGQGASCILQGHQVCVHILEAVGWMPQHVGLRALDQKQS